MNKFRHISLLFGLLFLVSSSCGNPNTNNDSSSGNQSQTQSGSSNNKQDAPETTDAQSTDTEETGNSGDQKTDSQETDTDIDASTDPNKVNPSVNPGNTDNDHTDHDTNDQVLKSAEEWARDRIAGNVSSEAAFRAISQNGGFPVHTSTNTLIFMHWYEGGNWAVAGDFNDWQPQAMSNHGDIWYLEVSEPSSGKNGYKFVNNGIYSADPFAKYYNFDEHGEISLLGAPSSQAYHQRWTMVSGTQGLKERTIRAYVPGGQGPFPVIYAHDGQNLFGGGWKIEEALDKIKAQIIVIGIDNTADRMAEYTHVDDTAFGTFYPTKGNKYAEFVNSTVRSLVENNLPASSKRGVMGSSLGGLISLYIAHQYPEDYSMVLALSPTTAWGRFGSDNGTTIEDLYRKAGHRNTVLFLDNGGYEPQGGCGILNQAAANLDESNNADDLDNYCYTRHFVNTMADEVGYQWEEDLYHWHETGAKHNEAAWAARVYRPLEIFNNL